MTDQLIGFGLFWGVWMVVPLIIDGVTAFAYLTAALRAKAGRTPASRQEPLKNYPLISIIIPAYNGADDLPVCLKAVRDQTYPHASIEVLVVDNQSTDDTRSVMAMEQERTFAGSINFISLPYKGKAGALNAGIHHSRGDLILNVDADTALDKNALLEMARAFEEDDKLAAATGSVEVLPPDQDPLTGEPVEVHPLRYALAQAEFVEYYEGFRIGRQYQSQTGSLFTLAGAFSAFRRDIMLRTFMYDQRTVSEDTDLTFYIAMNFPDLRVKAIASAIIYVHPTPSLQALYAQRVRWQRGQIEVAAMYPELERHPFRLRGISVVKSLLVDHTLAFPRVVWTFLLPFMFLLGYPLEVVITATLGLYLIYVGVEALYYLVALWVSEGEARGRLLKVWWIPVFMPLYRWLTFWFRFSGFLSVLTEPKQWRASDPLSESYDSTRRMGVMALTFLTQSFLPRLASLISGIVRIR
jgi:putative glycosyltransferase (exosortase G-associated)